MLMNFLGNQNHKIATQNWFLTKANLQESIHKNTQMISKDGIYDFFLSQNLEIGLEYKTFRNSWKKDPYRP